MQRSLLKFENAIKSEETRKKYNYCLNKFLEFAKIKEADGLLQLKNEFLQELVEDYLFYLKAKISPNSLSGRFSAIELFFAMNDKMLNWKKIKKMYPATVKKSGKDPWTTHDIQMMLQQAKSKRLRAMILIMASTGCRIGAFANLKMKNLTEIENCKAIHLYEGTNEEYWTFLTPEASEALDDYFNKRKLDREIIGPESPVFRKVYRIGSGKAFFTHHKTLMMQIYKIINTSGLERTKQGTRYNIQMDHGFRKRFNTILKDNIQGNISLKEKLMGHRGVFELDGTYHQPNLKKLFQEFQLHIANLTINDVERERAQKEKVIKENKILYEDKSLMRNIEKEIQEVRMQQQRHEIMNKEKEGDLLKKIADLEARLNKS